MATRDRSINWEALPPGDLIAHLRDQERQRQKILGFVVAAALHLLLLAGLGFVVLASRTPEPPTIVATTLSGNPTEPPPKRQIDTLLPHQRPAAPSASASNLIATQAISPIAIPVVPSDLDTVSVGIHTGEGFGFGLGGNGQGSGAGMSFFGNRTQAKQVAFVVDVSQSMSDQQMALMKNELSRSLKALPQQTKYQVIFFSGPVWYAHQEIDRASSRNEVIIKDGRTKHHWHNPNGRANGYIYEDGRKPFPVSPWLPTNSTNIRRTIKQVQEVGQSYGTTWRQPLRMALSMSPKPDAIYFMTDGTVADAPSEVAEVNNLNRETSPLCRIYTTSMMEPRAANHLAQLAKDNGGTFSIVNADGSVTLSP